MSDRPTHIVGSGNVFADIGVSDPDLALEKAKIVRQIAAVIEARTLTQKQAGAILGLDQASLSKLLRGRVRGYSLDRLVKFLNLFDFDVEMHLTPVVRPKSEHDHGRFVVYGSELPMAAAPNPKKDGVRFD